MMIKRRFFFSLVLGAAAAGALPVGFLKALVAADLPGAYDLGIWNSVSSPGFVVISLDPDTFEPGEELGRFATRQEAFDFLDTING